VALQLAENPYAAPPEGPRIPRHANPRDGRPWIRNLDDPDPAPELAWDADRQIWMRANPNKDRKRGAYFTRASSYGKGLDSAYLRHEAEKRRIVWAMGRFPELVRAAQVAAAKPYDEADRGELARLAEKAYERAGGESAAWLGTSFHELRAQRDAGVDLSYLDPVTLAGLAMWCRVTAPLELVSSEQFVANYALGAAGSYDAVFRVKRTIVVRSKDDVVMGHLEPGELVIGDLKSGRWGMEFAGPPWACQALVYDGGKPYDHDRGAYDWPAGEPNHRFAVIVACNPERASEAGLHWVDLTAAKLRAEAVPLWKAACCRDDLFFPHVDTPEPVAIAAGIGIEIDRAASPAELLDIYTRHGSSSLWTDELAARMRARIAEFQALVSAAPLP
jgi:hypothetical protein